MTRIGLETPHSIQTRTCRRAARARQYRLPAIIRPSFTMGGTGGGIAYTKPNSSRSSNAVSTPRPPTSPDRGIVVGWKEFEMEVCATRKTIASSSARSRTSIRWGSYRRFHHGAPALTLTDKEYQIMRDASLAVLREIGWRPADPTCSSASIRPTGAWW